MNNATYPEIRKAEAAPVVSHQERQERLLRHLEGLLPNPAQASSFRTSMTTEPAAAIRLNTLMPGAQQLGAALRRHATAVPWCDDAFVLADSERQCGRSLEHALGAVYIQAKATTLAVEALDPQPSERVLDMAAAPGGKATQIAARMQNTGLLVANEPRRRRVPALVGNLERCGVHCAVVTRAPGTLLARQFHNFFDRVLLDAPCSGDGILCKNQSMLRYWSVEDARNKSQQQIGLIRAAFHTLRPGGTLVYSTCSLSTEENEEVLLGLMRRYGDLVELLPVHAGIGDSGPLSGEIAQQYPAAFRHAVRVWPHLHDTEGAFVARIRKTGPSEWRHQDAMVADEAGSAAECAMPTSAIAAVEEEPGAAPSAAAATATAGRRYIEAHWGLRIPLPPGHEFAQNGNDFHLCPSESDDLRGQLGALFVRAGMRVASLNKGHYYLTHQAMAMWSHLMQSPPSVHLDWTQTQALFAHEPVHLEQPLVPGDVICWHDSRALCRAIVRAGNRLESFLPRSLRGIKVQRLIPESAADQRS